MELIKDIYFNTDKLIENTKVKVSYTGKFYQKNSDHVFIHYGYGKNWNNVNEVEMIKTDLGYQTELELVGGDTLNFCFKNQNNEWDNNSGQNYIFNIEKPNVNQYGKTTVGANNTTPTGTFFGKTFETTVQPISNSNNIETNPTVGNLVISNNGNNNNIISGIIEDAVIGTPNSVDTVINKADNISEIGNSTLNNITPTLNNVITPVIENTTPNLNNEMTQKITYNLGGTITPSPISTPTKFENTKINIITPLSTAIKNTANQAVNITKNTVNKVTTATKNYINQNQDKKQIQTQNALTVKPTGFNAWTQKVKTTIGKFFAYVPKLISGNYKRNVTDKNK